MFDYMFGNWKDKQKLMKVITYKGTEEQPMMEANDVCILLKIQNRTSGSSPVCKKMEVDNPF